MHDTWETEIAALLTELAEVQTSLLGLLAEKRHLLTTGDSVALQAMAGREQQLIDRLQACHASRQQLLHRAGEQGLPDDSIRSLSAALPPESRQRMQPSIEEASERCRFLQQQSLTNWVVVQRTLLHLSQLIEIIATGGRMQPTYGNGPASQSSGALVDRAV